MFASGYQQQDPMIGVGPPSVQLAGMAMQNVDNTIFGAGAGAYASGSRARMPMTTSFPSESGIARIYDGSNAGEGFFGGAIRRTVPRGNTNMLDARHVMVAAKIAGPNKFEQPFSSQWYDGTAMFCVEDSEELAHRPISVATGGSNPVTLMNAAQLSFAMRDAAEEASTRKLAVGLSCPLPSIVETAEQKKAREEREVKLRMSESEFYDSAAEKEKLTKDNKKLLWNNIFHVDTNLRFAGFFNGMIARETRVDVDLAIAGNFKVFNYWGKEAQIGDWVGYIVRRPTDDAKCNAIVVESWRSHDRPYPTPAELRSRDWADKGKDNVGVFIPVGIICDIDPAISKAYMPKERADEVTSEQRALLGAMTSTTQKYDALQEYVRVAKSAARNVVVNIGSVGAFASQVFVQNKAYNAIKPARAPRVSAEAAVGNAFDLDFGGFSASSSSTPAQVVGSLTVPSASSSHPRRTGN